MNGLKEMCNGERRLERLFIWSKTMVRRIETYKKQGKIGRRSEDVLLICVPTVIRQ